jgi:tRNA A-37 threonylcarbamoyl transferase component Bud32
MKLGQVQIERRIGRGGMADVYLGHHLGLDRPVAVKLLHAHLVDQEQGARRFLAEARAIAQLRHPNIVQVYDFQVLDGRPSIVMEWLPGPPLSRYLRSVTESGLRLPPGHVSLIITQVAKALDHAHAHGIVHRDVKPANILLRSLSRPIELARALPNDVEAVLSDFGVARIAATSMRTATGTILGTPAYMAPEQVTGGNIDARTDIYALAVVAYEMLVGQVPYPTEDDTPVAALFKHVHEPIPPMDELPQSVAVVLRRGLAKDPAGRHLTAGEFGRDLQRALNQDHAASVTMKGKRPASITRALNPRPKRTAAMVGLILVAFAVALSGIGWLMRDQLVALIIGPPLMADALGVPGTATPNMGLANSGERSTETPAATDTAAEVPAPAGGALSTARPSATSPPATRAPDQRPSSTPSPTVNLSDAKTPMPSSTPTPVPTRAPTKGPTSTPQPIIAIPTLEIGG